MYQRILLAYDGSREGRAALRQGARIAKQGNAETFLLACMRIPDEAKIDAILPPELTQSAIDENQKILDEGVEILSGHDINAIGYLRHGDPSQVICQFAIEHHIDLIVLGHKPKSALARWWRGSVESSILEHAPCSVLIALDEQPE